MLKSSLLTGLVKHLSTVLPAEMHQLKEDTENKFHAILQATFAKLDLVTREEFDIQCSVLAATRAKLMQLEQQVAALEQSLL